MSETETTKHETTAGNYFVTNYPPFSFWQKEQAFAVVTFLGGFLFRLAYGIARVDSAKDLEVLLRSVIAGVAAEHGR